MYEKYVEEMVKLYGEGFDWHNELIEGRAVYASGDGKDMDGEIDAVFYLTL
jgi:hypothetical protein